MFIIFEREGVIFILFYSYNLYCNIKFFIGEFVVQCFLYWIENGCEYSFFGFFCSIFCIGYFVILVVFFFIWEYKFVEGICMLWEFDEILKGGWGQVNCY